MENPETVRDEPTTVANRSQPNPPVQGTAQPAQPAQIQVTDSDAVADYANFCRISGTPEELLIDFGLNPEPVGTPTKPIVVTQRIVTNWYTAKRLLGVLQTTVARHEAVFGALETDVQRRIQRQ